MAYWLKRHGAEVLGKIAMYRSFKPGKYGPWDLKRIF